MPFGRKSSRFSGQKYSFLPKSPRSARKAVRNNFKPTAITRRTSSSRSRQASNGFPAINLKNLNWGTVKEFFRHLFTTKEGWKVLGICALVGVACITGLFLWYAKDLPSPDKINAKVSAQSTQIFDRNGKLLYEIHGNQNRILASWNEIPDNVKHATIAIEDKNFYNHGGFDIFGIGRAFVGVVTHDSAMGGGSTITQQLVKNALLTNEPTITRKIKELILSMEIEQMYSKDDILKMYLNEIPYGSNAYGIKVAAKTFFNEDLNQLDLAQSALLAALPNAPTYYSPFGNHVDELMARKDRILDLMAEQGYITKAQATTAKAEKLTFSNNPYGSIEAPHFVMYVKEQLVDKYGENMVDNGGLKVYTTLDDTLQQDAQTAVDNNVDNNKIRYGANNAGLTAVDPKTGQILAMVGSRDYFDQSIDGQVNVTIADRQPGSSFKPFAYATAWKNDNTGPGTMLYDLRTDFGGGYIPQNYSGNFWGPVSMRTALQNSLNIPAVKTLYIAGIQQTLDTAHSMGITTLNDPSQYGLSLVLGAGEVKLLDMTSAYGVFADQGVKHDTTWFLRIEDSNGKVLDQYKDSPGKQIIDPQVAYLMSNVLSDDAARAHTFGAGSALTLSDRPVAAKTGTTNSYKDAWTIGYTPSLVAGVWSGNNDGTPMTSGGGAFAAAPIWHDFMTAALAGKPAEQFQRPSGVKTVTLDAITGRAPGGSSQTETDLFPSWYKVPDYNGQQQIQIDKLTGKQVNSQCPPTAANIQTKTIGTITAEIPSTDAAYDRWFAPIAAWAQANGYSTSSANIATDSCQTKSSGPTVSILSPNDGDTVSAPLDVRLSVKPISGTSITSASVTINGDTEPAKKNGSNYVAHFNSLDPGNYDITVVVTDNTGGSTTTKISITVS
jgi:1A family penicillin-binding protein